MGLGALVEEDRTNATAAWALVAALGVVGSLALASGDLLWAAFVAGVVGVAAAPAVLARAPLVTPPWEVVAVAALPAGAYLLSPGEPVRQVVVYVAVVALGLLVVAQLHLVGPVEMPPWFAVGFAVLAALAAAGAWTMLRFAADVYLGTDFLTTADDLMWELVTATAAAVAAGPPFRLYFGRYA